MERRSWLWKRKSSDRSPGETESSGSISSHSERYSDEQVEQEGSKESPNHMQSPEVTSKVAIMNEEVHDSVKSLAEKLSAALVNVGAKEDLVKQHAKVAEEAVAGWEKAENEITMLKQQLEAAVQQNLALEVRVNHLDGALKECVRQLRQARDEQEQRIHEAVEEKTCEWESTKGELETQFRDLQTQLLDLQTQAEATKSQYHPPIDSNVHLKLETLERENSILKFELLTQSEELEILTIERDLSTQAAETASKQQLESIKKVAKLEAECRRLQALARKSPSINDHKAVSISSLGVDSLTDSQSDSGERLNAIEIDTFKMGKVENNDSEPSCSDSWASALIAELDQFKNGKVVAKNVALPEIDIMDDFLEMERLAALPENQSKTHCSESENVDNSLRAELEAMGHQVAELEEKLEKLEAEKVKLENALSMRQDSLAASEAQLAKTENRMVDLQKELTVVNESRELLEFQLASMEAESHTMSTKVDSLKADVEKERSLSAEMAVKCQELEKELTRKAEEVELLQHTASSNGEAKEKQEELAVVAADRLAECQKTISSLARQLESLATLEDFLIDTANLPGISIGSSIPRTGGELWKLHSNDTFMPKSNSDCSKQPEENLGPLINGNAEESPSSSSSSTSSAVSLTHVKSKSSLGKLFSRSKSGIQVENRQG